MMKFEDFWYVVALSRELPPQRVLSRTVLGEWLAIWRDQDGQPVALRDRCLHRQSPLSCGNVQQGTLQCPYHGWRYDPMGQVVAIPSEGPTFQPLAARRTPAYAIREQDGYIYVRLAADPAADFAPFSMPHCGEPGWQSVRLVNRFANSVTHCAENFIDIPHTAFVHPGIFRQSRQQPLQMTVQRRSGSVQVDYRQETTNLGWYQRFLNGRGGEIYHCDRFYMPNITSVEYLLAPQRHLFITSQAIPETDTSTLVYTDVTFNYGIWSWLARPLVRWTAQRIIDQDVQILKRQGQAIAQYGTRFCNSPADVMHEFVESIREAIAQGEDPRQLPDQRVEVRFWV